MEWLIIGLIVKLFSVSVADNLFIAFAFRINLTHHRENSKISAPEPKVILVPARFTQRVPPIDILSSNPVYYLTGAFKLHKLLNEYTSSSSGAHIEFILVPDTNVSSLVHGNVSVPLSNKLLGKPVGGLDMSLSGDFAQSMHGSGRVAISSQGGMIASAYIRKYLAESAADMYCRADASETSIGARFVGSSNLIGIEASFDPVTKTSGFSKAYGMVDSGSVTIGGEVSLNQKSFPYNLHACISSNRATSNRATMNLSITGTGLPTNVTLGFLQQMVTKRRVYNPLEDKRVKFIANYVDVGCEVSRTADSTSLAAGVAWQPNKNLLFKSRISSMSGVSLTAACKSWWTPSITAAVTAGLSHTGPYTGIQLKVQNTGQTDYSLPDNTDHVAGHRWDTITETSRFDDGLRFDRSVIAHPRLVV